MKIRDITQQFAPLEFKRLPVVKAASWSGAGAILIADDVLLISYSYT
ncbi:hypothetical protein P9222_11750 [Paenibacillus amylolyticus]|nr:hypothetical protein [Paenibacillus amylolyticus]WFR64696.1 hypothetical protein P9222_11750 [Paenibacillus amylolyticus]